VKTYVNTLQHTLPKSLLYRTFQCRWQGLRALVSIVVVALVLALPPGAAAHPLGNFTTNRYSRLELLPDRIRLRYVLDMAEIPTFQELPILDRDRDGHVNEAELAAYAETKAAALAAQLFLAVDGARLELSRAGIAEAALLPGQGGLQTLRLALWLEAQLPPGPPDARRRAVYRDSNYPDRLGWKEIVVHADGGSAVLTSTAPAEDRSDELRRYPEDMLRSPLDRREAVVTFQPGIAAATGDPGSTASQTRQRAAARTRDPLAELIALPELSTTAIILALLAAMFWGAGHALSPGHGKTVVAAYLVGSRGTARHALLLGLTVTVTHTAAVYALGLVTLGASHLVAPEKLYPWLSVLSGIMVAALGSWLLATRLRAAVETSVSAGFAAPRADQTRPVPVAAGAAATGAHIPPPAPALAVQVPLDVQDHALAHVSALPRAPLDHTRPQRPAGESLIALPRHTHADRQVHPHGHPHGHSGRVHSHLPPGAGGSPVTWHSLLALGVSGGLLPCPSALVVLLGALALHRTGLGLALVVAFSAGLAATLSAIGLLFVYGRRMIEQLPGRAVPGRTLAPRVAPLISAAVITLAGLALTVRALWQLGVPGL
jgi:nickel/cobalt exporter